GQPVQPSVSPSRLQDEVTRLHVAQLAQSLSEGSDVCRRGSRRQKTDPVNFPHLLRLDGERRGEEGPRASGEGSPRHYSTTSSARASTEGGIGRPRARAALRLITSSNVVGRWTGRSPGLAPLRIRST